MHKIYGYLLIPLVLALPYSSAHAEITEADLIEACQTAKKCSLLSRVQVSDTIHHYTFEVKVGGGEYDVIQIHRVVKETAAGKPIQTSKNVFMVHGALWGFNPAFMGTALLASMPQDQSIAVYLAQNNVDVWGIDTRRVHVPESATDFTFMRDWNVGTDVNDMRIALGFARIIRRVTGSGLGKMTLLGWSLGAVDVYAYLNAETQLPHPKRHVKAAIPVDGAFKYGPDSEVTRVGACNSYNAGKVSYDSGVSEGGISGPAPGVGLKTIGFLAATAPNDPSPIAPGLTNLQTSIFGGAATFNILPPNAVPAPLFHFNAGIFSSGFPIGLQYSNLDYVNAFLQEASPYQSLAETLDLWAINCGEIDVPYDDHLAQITVPVLYVGAAGGYGVDGLYTTTLLGSTDLTTHMVTFETPENRIADYGHADLFLADNAKTEVWTPILNWITSH